MSTESDSLAASFGRFVGLMALSIAQDLWGGYVIATLWRWFLVSSLHVPVLPTLGGAAILLILRVGTVTQMPKDRNVGGEEVLFMFIFPAIALFIGWVLTFWL